MKTNENNLTPAEVFPPGEFIRDELEARGLTQQDLAEIMNTKASALSLIMTGKRAITPSMAKSLAMALGTSADFWMNLESAYRLSITKDEDNEIARRARLYAIAPVGEMMRRGWIEQSSSAVVIEAQLKRFFETDDLDTIPSLAAARKSTSYAETSPAQRAWEYRVRRLGRAVHASPFDPARFAMELPKLRAATVYPENLRKLPAVLASWGIRLVLVSHLEGTRLDGATLWLDGAARREPVVGLTLRFDRIDWFWFTLMHELIHVKHGEASIDSDLVKDAKGEGGEGSAEESERRANAEAAAVLVPQDKLESFIIRHRPMYSRDSIVNFARLHGVHPGIVVGQLHHRKEMPSKNLRDLLEQKRIRGLIAGHAMTDDRDREAGAF